MNKSLVTNCITLIITIGGYYIGGYTGALFNLGIFALSGSITNTLAIHMLFEKVPLLYGSGVVVVRFVEFKQGIKQLVMTQFFNSEHIKVMMPNLITPLSVELIQDKINFDKVFDDLVAVIMSSSLGNMLGMFGGSEALANMRAPIIAKLKSIIHDVIINDIMTSQGGNEIKMLHKIERIIDARLEDVTPRMVKKIIQNMIRKHLGWLVVWGGVFGGLIGLVISLIS